MTLLTLLQDHMASHSLHGVGIEEIFGLLELPFLVMAVVFSFLTAGRLKGGKFGKGMQLLAWGFLVMAVGHLHMQVDHVYGYNLFNNLFGNSIGRYVWFVALMATWGLSTLGFYQIYKASKL